MFHSAAMAKSRKDRAEAERREAVAAQRIWPIWARTLGGMIEAEAIVRFACDACRKVYDVDLQSLAVLRGREWGLIGRRARCKASKCRKSGAFVAALGRDMPFMCLGGEMPHWLVGARPQDHEPTGDDRPPPPPPGVDGVRWAYATVEERKRMVREARG